MRFKVGDKVRTTKDRDIWDALLFPVGTIGTVAEIDTEPYEGSYYPYRVATQSGSFWYAENMLEPYEEKTYDQGLAEAWELVRKITAMGNDGRDLVFGYPTIPRVMETHSAEEALSKMKYYEDLKIAPNKVVEDNEGTRALVLDEAGNGVFSVLTENGCVESWNKKGIVAIREKTIDVSELVKQIGDRENEVH